MLRNSYLQNRNKEFHWKVQCYQYKKYKRDANEFRWQKVDQIPFYI